MTPMICQLDVKAVDFPLHTPFRIARGVKTHAAVIEVTLSSAGVIGRGECVPYARYGESVAGVLAAIESIRPSLAAGVTPESLQQLLPAGAARNAVDCALWDLIARSTGRSVGTWLNLDTPPPVTTAWTLTVDSPDAMAIAAQQAADKTLLKLKLTGDQDIARVAAVRAARPDATLVVDANESWTLARLQNDAPALADLGVALIEQPLPQADDAALADYRSPVPLYADESAHDRRSLGIMRGRYAGINIKLDKTGGLTEAVALALAAKAEGLHIMLGCMVSSSLSLAPALWLSPFADYVDLDGALWLAEDRAGGLHYHDGMVSAAAPGFWGS